MAITARALRPPLVGSPIASTRLREYSAMDVTDDYTAQNLSARQRDVMNLIVRGLSNKEIASILNLAEGLTAKECLQSAEGCLALAHKTKCPSENILNALNRLWFKVVT